MRAKPRAAAAQAGFSLLELMIATAIIAIIATVAVPAYQQYAVNTVRAQAKAQLTQVATRQEQFYLDNKGYATSMTDLGYGANPYYVDRDGREVSASSSARVYKLSFSAASATAFSAQAEPLQAQATRDTDCGTLTLTHTGVKGKSGAGADCW